MPEAAQARIRFAAAIGLALMAAVLFASGALRLGAGDALLGPLSPFFRALHRTVATAEVLVVLWLCWLAAQARQRLPMVFAAALFALAVTVVLSAVGIAGGRNPPAALSAINLLGGLALASALAVALARARPSETGRLRPPVLAAIGLLSLQVGLGVAMTIGRAGDALLPLHGLVAMPLSGLACWLALTDRAMRSRLLAAAALVAPLAGMSALHFDHSAVAALAHSASAALFVIAGAGIVARGASRRVP